MFAGKGRERLGKLLKHLFLLKIWKSKPIFIHHYSKYLTFFTIQFALLTYFIVHMSPLLFLVITVRIMWLIGMQNFLYYAKIMHCSFPRQFLLYSSEHVACQTTEVVLGTSPATCFSEQLLKNYYHLIAISHIIEYTYASVSITLKESS